MEGFTNANLGIKSVIQLGFFHLDLPDHAVAFVPENGLEETDLQRGAEIEHAETLGRDSLTRIAEPRRVLPEAERIRVGQPMNAPKILPRRDRRNVPPFANGLLRLGRRGRAHLPADHIWVSPSAIHPQCTEDRDG